MMRLACALSYANTMPYDTLLLDFSICLKRNIECKKIQCVVVVVMAAHPLKSVAPNISTAHNLQIVAPRFNYFLIQFAIVLFHFVVIVVVFIRSLFITAHAHRRTHAMTLTCSIEFLFCFVSVCCLFIMYFSFFSFDSQRLRNIVCPFHFFLLCIFTLFRHMRCIFGNGHTKTLINFCALRLRRSADCVHEVCAWHLSDSWRHLCSFQFNGTAMYWPPPTDGSLSPKIASDRNATKAHTSNVAFGALDEKMKEADEIERKQKLCIAR